MGMGPGPSLTASLRSIAACLLLAAQLGVHGAWMGRTLAGARWEARWEPPSLLPGFVAGAAYREDAGVLYFADRDSHCVQAVGLTPPGPIATIAGSQRGLADGAGAAAKFDSPAGLALLGTGLVRVCL